MKHSPLLTHPLAGRSGGGSVDQVPHSSVQSATAATSGSKKSDRSQLNHQIKSVTEQRSPPQNTEEEGDLSKSFSQSVDCKSEAKQSPDQGEASKEKPKESTSLVSRETKLVNAMKDLLKDGKIRWGSFAIAKLVVAQKKGKPVAKLETDKPFSQWLATNGDLPDKMNCWESVLFAGYKADLISFDDIPDLISSATISANEMDEKILHNSTGSVKFVKIILEHHETKRWLAGDKKFHLMNAEGPPIVISAGQVIIFGKAGEHVALSLGGQSLIEVDSHSGADIPGRISESTLSTVMNRNSAYSGQISWGAFPELVSDAKNTANLDTDKSSPTKTPSKS